MEQEEPEEQTGRRGLALTLTAWKEARLRTHDPLDMCLEGQDCRTSAHARSHAPRMVAPSNGEPGVHNYNALRTCKRFVVRPQILELEGMWTFFRLLPLSRRTNGRRSGRSHRSKPENNELRTCRRLVVGPQILGLEGMWPFLRLLPLSRRTSGRWSRRSQRSKLVGGVLRSR